MPIVQMAKRRQQGIKVTELADLDSALKAMLSTLVHLASLESTTPLPLEELIPHLKTAMLNVGW